MPIDQEKRKEFFNSLRVAKPLDFSQENERQKYVEGLHGSDDHMDALFQSIELQDNQGVYLFSGQRGSGKSTELKRLKYSLEQIKNDNDNKRYKVYYLDMTEWLNYARPLELGSFLVAVLTAWVSQFPFIDINKPIVERFVKFLTDTEVKVDKVKFSAGFVAADMRFLFCEDDDFLQAIEIALKRNRSSFIIQVRQFIEETVNRVCPSDEKCVLLIDSLEKIGGVGQNAVAVLQSVLDLFSHHHSALQLPLVHAVYSIAPFVLEQNKNLGSDLGCAAMVQLPSVHVFQRNSCTPDEVGIGRMLDVFKKCCPGWEMFFDEDQVKRLAQDSGGDLRDFMRALQNTLLWVSDNAPRVTEAAMDKARAQIRPSLVIPKEHMVWMKRIDETHRPEIDDALGKDAALVLETYLNTKHILAYLNGETWYGLHPLIRQSGVGQAGEYEHRNAPRPNES